MNLDEVHTYWRSPGVENHPSSYVGMFIGRSLFLVDKMREHASSKDRILELGCNAGRNLAFLHYGGFKNLNAIEINGEAVELMRSTFPELRRAKVTVSSIEDEIRKIPSDSVDMIFSMAVLEHVHIDSEWIFGEIARVSPKIITIEDELRKSDRHFPRNYQNVFAALHFKQSDYAEKVPGLPQQFRFRFFERAHGAANH